MSAAHVDPASPTVRSCRVEQSVTFDNARGERLSGVLHMPECGTADAGVVLCHGMESSKESPKILAMSRFLSRRGLSALRFDFAGSGDSGGSFAEISYSGQVEDLEAAVACLSSRGASRIGLIGSSMGGSVALLYAGVEAGIEHIAAVATIAAPSDPLEILEQFASPAEIQAWEERGFTEYHGHRLGRALLDDIRRLDIVRAASRIRCPVIIIHGDADITVPVHQAYRLYEAVLADRELLVLPGADHRLSRPRDMAEAVHAAQDWILLHVRHS